MGFRNPITTAVDPTARALANQALTNIIPGSRLAADAIDGMTITGVTLRTGADGQPRVRVYEGTDGKGNPIGIVALEDGVTGDVAAQLSAGSYGGLGGGALTISGGTYAGKAAASLTLSTDQAGLQQASLTAANGFNVNGLPVAGGIPWTYIVNNTTYSLGLTSSWADMAGCNFTLTPPIGVMDVEWRAPKVALSSGGVAQFRLLISGVVFDAEELSASGPGRLTGTVNSDGTTSRTVQVQGRYVAGTSASVLAGGIGPVVLRYLLH